MTASLRGARMAGHNGPIDGVAFSPDGYLIATAGRDGTARLWDPATGEHRHTLTGHRGSVLAVAFSPDGRLLATAGDGGTLRRSELPLPPGSA